MNKIVTTNMVRYPECHCSKTWRKGASVWQPGEVGLGMVVRKGFAVVESGGPKLKSLLHCLIATLSWAGNWTC